MDQWNLPGAEAEAFAPATDEYPSSTDAGWKDELNLAEFPIAALADRVPDGQRTLVFEDRFEQRDSTPIVRRLTIMGTHRHGLPTSLDDEVLVGLIQLTKRRSNFTDARVEFSRYELIELLGWPQSGQSYRRIEEALHRWVGVVLMYENAWWDNQAKSWVDEQFHVLDNVTLYDREKWRTSVKATKNGAIENPEGKAQKPPLPLSSFRWNEVIFRSFQSGNLKQLDLEFYLKLRLPTTKRMYRFLDKRFYRRSRLDFDLRTLACEHIGLSRSYAPTELKRRLKPALEELEQLGFLDPLPPEERYAYVKRGCWRILLTRGRRSQIDARNSVSLADAEQAQLIDALKRRGVASKTAQELVESHPSIQVRAKIEVFDWLLRNEDKRIGKNPAGYLVTSIRFNYQPPVDYRNQITSQGVGSALKPLIPLSATQLTSVDIHLQSEKVREAKLRAAWERLPTMEREAILAIVKADNPGLGRWKNMLEPLCLSLLEVRMNETSEGTSQGLLFPPPPLTE
jgi:Replication initiator protein A